MASGDSLMFIDPILDVGRFRMPFSDENIPSNIHYVNRPDEILKIKNALQPDGGNPEQPFIHEKIFVLYGLGGIGKTQIAAAFARRHQEDFTAVFWVDASTKKSISRSVAPYVDKIPMSYAIDIDEQPVENDEKVDIDITTFKTWLSEPGNTDWLLVLDNVDEEYHEDEIKFHERIWAGFRQGSILVTSRLTSRALMTYPSNSIMVDKVSRQISLNIFRSWRETERMFPKTLELLEILDGLPLALASAGRYIRQTGISVSEYHGLWKHKQWDTLLNDQAIVLPNYHSTIGAAWKRSLGKALACDVNALKLIWFWDFLSHKDMSHDILRNLATISENDHLVGPVWLLDMARDERLFSEAVSLLQRHSLVTTQPTNEAYLIHPVVRESLLTDTKLRADFEERITLLQAATKLIGFLVPLNTDREYWILNQRLLPHADRVSWWLRTGVEQLEFLDPRDMSITMRKLGDLYKEQGKLARAEKMYVLALSGCEWASVRGALASFKTVHNLGCLCLYQGRITEAREKLLLTHHILEGRVPSDSPVSLELVNSFGILYKDQGQYNLAESMVTKAINGYRDAFGSDHVLTLASMNDLGSIYQKQDKVDGAKDMYKKAFDGFEKLLGRAHPRTLEVASKLGALYDGQNRSGESQWMCEQALDGLRSTLGKADITTLAAAENLAFLLARQQHGMEKAEGLYRSVLDGRAEVLGPEHPLVLKAAESLGKVYEAHGKLYQAERLYSRILQVYEKTCGPNDLLTLRTVSRIGFVQKQQNRSFDAARSFGRAFDGLGRTLGYQNQEVRSAARNLDAVMEAIPSETASDA